MKSLLRYGAAILGPAGSAGAQFLISLLLLHHLSPAEFGSFSFLLVASVLATSLWSALFCAPLVVSIHADRAEGGSEAVPAILSMSTAGAIIAFLAFLAISAMLALPVAASLVYAASSALALIRWLGRSYGYALDRPMRVTLSDMVYTLVLLAAIGVLLTIRNLSLTGVFGAILAATLTALIACGGDLVAARLPFGANALRGYRRIWKDQSSWSLAGAVSTEATVNCQVYLVTAISGPAALAPITATQLLVRPVTITMNALMDYERAQVARHLAAADRFAVRRSLRSLRLAVLAVWALTAAGSALLLLQAPGLAFPITYDFTTLTIGAGSWLALAFVRAVRIPEATLLLADGAFRELAFASIQTAGISIVAVLAVLWVAPPIWSSLGVLAGEIAYLYLLSATVSKWWRDRFSETAPPIGVSPESTQD